MSSEPKSYKTEFTPAEMAEMLSESAHIVLIEQDVKHLLDINGFLVVLAPIGRKLEDGQMNDFRIVGSTQEVRALTEYRNWNNADVVSAFRIRNPFPL